MSQEYDAIRTLDERVDITNWEDVWRDGLAYARKLPLAVIVERWRSIPSGIEFERADGSFIWIKLTDAQMNSLAAHLERVGYRHHAVADYPSSRDQERERK